MRFKLQCYESNKNVVTHEFEEPILSEVIERLTLFLKAAGFCFGDEYLDLTSNEAHTIEQIDVELYNSEPHDD